MFKKIFLVILLIVLALGVGLIIQSKNSIPSDIPVDTSVRWSKPVPSICYWSSLYTGNEKRAWGYKIETIGGNIGGAFYEELMRDNGWHVDNWLDATEVGEVDYSKGNKIVTILTESVPKNDPNPEQSRVSICYASLESKVNQNIFNLEEGTVYLGDGSQSLL